MAQLGNAAYEKHPELSLAQWRETPSKSDRGVESAINARFEWGSAFACGLLCCGSGFSREWLDNGFGAETPRTARAAQPHDPTAVATDEHATIEFAARKDRFATRDIIEIASKHWRHPLCIIGIPSGIAGQRAAINEDGDGPDLIT